MMEEAMTDNKCSSGSALPSTEEQLADYVYSIQNYTDAKEVAAHLWPFLNVAQAQTGCDTERCVLQNQIEIMGALSLLLRYANPDLIGKAGELDRQRDDLVDRHKATQKALAVSSADRPAPPELLPPRPKWPTKGDCMTFLGKNGYEFELKEALNIFRVGQQYRVLECNVQSWSHSIRFEDVIGWYNGVMFEPSSVSSTDRERK